MKLYHRSRKRNGEVRYERLHGCVHNKGVDCLRCVGYVEPPCCLCGWYPPLEKARKKQLRVEMRNK